MIFYNLCFLIVSISFLLAKEQCPEVCVCTFLKRVDCQHKNLSTIPTSIPKSVEVLDLRHNFIRFLEVEKLSQYKKLHTLLLNDNQIRHLNEVS